MVEKVRLTTRVEEYVEEVVRAYAAKNRWSISTAASVMLERQVRDMLAKGEIKVGDDPKKVANQIAY